MKDDMENVKGLKEEEIDVSRNEVKGMEGERKEEVDVLRGEIENLKVETKEEIELLREEIEKMKAEKKEEIDVLRGDIEKMTAARKEEIDVLREEIEAMKEEIAELNEQNKKQNMKLKLKERNEGLKNDNCSLGKELEQISLNKLSKTGNVTQPITTESTFTSTSYQILKGPSVGEITCQTYFDFTIDNQPIGRLLINLFTNEAPQTCAKFMKLCTNETGVGYIGGKVTCLGVDYCGMGDENQLTYPRGSHHVLPQELETPNVETKWTATHDEDQLVSMVIDRGVTKSCFAVMFKPFSGSGNCVVIGRVSDETWSVMEEIKKVKTNLSGKPIQSISIINCGVVG